MSQANERTPQLHRILVLLAIVIAFWPTTSEAHRFGPPWQARVSVDRTVAYAKPAAAAAQVGPLARGQVVVVLGETKAPDGSDWTQIPDGYVKSSDVIEETLPWIAEVAQP